MYEVERRHLVAAGDGVEVVFVCRRNSSLQRGCVGWWRGQNKG